MKHGFLKVATASPKLKVADVKYNVEAIKQEIVKAAKAGGELLVFPELCLSGYTCGDLFLQPTLLSACKKALVEIATFCSEIPTLSFIGLPFSYNGKLYNAAAAISGGRVLAIIPKTNIPNYAEYNEARYFTPAPKTTEEIEFFGESVPFGTDVLICDEKDENVKIACEICEDLWVANSPCVSHTAAGATVVVNLSASSETVGKAENRRLLIQAQSHKCCCGYVYADAGKDESTTDVVFAGHNLVAEKGKLLAETDLFSGETVQAEIDVSAIVLDRISTNTFCSDSSKKYIKVYASFTGAGDLSVRKINPSPFIPACGEQGAKRA